MQDTQQTEVETEQTTSVSASFRSAQEQTKTGGAELLCHSVPNRLIEAVNLDVFTETFNMNFYFNYLTRWPECCAAPGC